jgi:predicted permease
MSWFDAARYRIRNLLRADGADREREEEYAFHRSLAEAEHIHATGDREEAPYAARREFGNAARIKEDVRWMGAVRWIDQCRQDLRFATRTLARSPVFAGVAVMSIAVSIAANTAVFAVINALMFERLPVPNARELTQLWRADTAGRLHPFFTFAESEAVRAASGVDVSLLVNTPVTRAVIAGTSYQRLSCKAVDGGLFSLLGIRAAAGRLLTPADDRDAVPVAVLGFDESRRYFGSPQDAVGQQITLQGHPFTIVGVLPRAFRGLEIEGPMRIVVPRRASRVLQSSANPDGQSDFMLVTRLGPGTEERRIRLEHAFAACCANGELAAGRQTYDPEVRQAQRLTFTGISRGIAVGKFHIREMFGRVLYTLMAGVMLILLITCTNIGNLLLARGAVRWREIAVRMSLGASRARIVRQLLAESVLLAVLGATAGAALAVWGTSMLAEHLPGNLRILEPYVEVTPNLAVAGFTIVIAAGCTTLFGVLPAIRATKLDPIDGLRNGSPAVTRTGRLDRGILAFQMALALVLVASAALLGTTLRNLRSGLGDLQPDRLLVADVEVDRDSTAEGAERATYDRVMERLRTIPGVTAVAGTDVMPMMFMGFTTRTLDVPGIEGGTLETAGAGVIYTTPGFFATTGSGLVSGREFTDADASGAPLVAVVSETIARQFFPGRDPVGQMIGFKGGKRRAQIVGVARDVKQTDLRSAHPRTIYLARAQRPLGEDGFIYAIRTQGRAQTVAPAVRAAIAAAAPELVIRGVDPMSTHVAFMVGREQALGAVAVVFSVVAVGLAAVGLYGVMAFHVTSRSREIGIRMALGADRRRIVGMVMRQSLVVVATGIAAGVPLALAASSGLRALLYGIHPFAPAPFVAAILVLAGAGLLAALVPSRSASRVDPLVAIRAE